MIKLEELSFNGKVVLTIGIDETDESLVLIDKNKNTIRLGQNGISFDSDLGVNIKSRGPIKFDSDSGVNITSRGTIKNDGFAVDITAQTFLTARGSASAELSASGTTMVKGAMVMIN
jgi:hypothetical protein